ncbi:MAG: hypothetical protein ABIE94_07160 [archaeon]
MMRTKSHKIVICIFILLILFILPDQVSAVAIGVNKAVVTFSDVLRGGYAEQTVLVNTDATYTVPVSYEMEGEIADWFTILPNATDELKVNRTRKLLLKMILNPPADVATGNYTGNMRVSLGISGDLPGAIGTSIISAFLVKIKVEITGDEIVKCVAGGFEVVDTEIDFPTEFFATVRNQGNVRLSPSFILRIWDQDQETVMLSEEFKAGNNILPTTEEMIVKTLEFDLPIGQYWVDIESVECGNNVLRTFSIVERGGIIDQGEFVRLKAKGWAVTGEVVPINASFRNLGPRTVAAKFKGTASLNDQVIEVLESDELNVRPGETLLLQSFFKPEMAGRYTLSGRIIYNGKLTYERQATLNVNFKSSNLGGGDGSGVSWTVIIGLILVIVIIIILILIRTKQKSRRRVFR